MGRIYRRGRVWYADWFEDGQRRRESLRTSDEQEARDLAELYFGELSEGRTKRQQGRERPARLPRTVAEAVDAWMRRIEIEHAGKETVYGYRSQALRWRERWGFLPLEQLDRARLMEWRDERLEQVSRRTVKGDRAVMMSFLSWCVREGLIEAAPRIDPVRGVPKKRRYAEEGPPVLSDAEIQTLLRTARDHARPQVRAVEPVVWLGRYAGLRRAEICALEWGDVDVEERLIRVQPHGRFSPKNHERRTIPIGPSLAKYLGDRREARPGARWVAESAELSQWVVGSLTRWARRLWMAAGIHVEGGPVLHALRHTYGTELARSGADIETVRELMGHSSITVTELYFHTDLDRKRSAVARIG